MKRLKHVNILPFYGVSTTIFDLSLVFPWYNNGNIKHYLERNPGVDRYDLVSTFKLNKCSATHNPTKSCQARSKVCVFCIPMKWFMVLCSRYVELVVVDEV